MMDKIIAAYLHLRRGFPRMKPAAAWQRACKLAGLV